MRLSTINTDNLVFIDECVKDEFNKEMDIFDRICYVAFNQPLQQVLDTPLDKYADEGVENIKNMQILQVNPFNPFGSPMEIIDLFGGEAQYQPTLTKTEQQIYG